MRSQWRTNYHKPRCFGHVSASPFISPQGESPFYISRKRPLTALCSLLSALHLFPSPNNKQTRRRRRSGNNRALWRSSNRSIFDVEGIMTDIIDEIAEDISFQGFEDDCRLLGNLLNDVLQREVGSQFVEKLEKTRVLAQVVFVYFQFLHNFFLTILLVFFFWHFIGFSPLPTVGALYWNLVLCGSCLRNYWFTCNLLLRWVVVSPSILSI